MEMKHPEQSIAQSLGSPGRDSKLSIGQILVKGGFMDADSAERVARAQAQNGQSFGEAAVGLRLISHADIEFALASQFGYPYVLRTNGSISTDVIAAYKPQDPFVEQIRALRTQLITYRAAHPDLSRSISIVSPVRGEGRSLVAANLAVAFSQLGERTLLIDADLRTPTQHELFRLPRRAGLSNMLLGRAGSESFLRVDGFLDLTILTAGSVPPNPQELLTRPRMNLLLIEAIGAYDIVIVDTPPASLFSDAQLIASRTGASVVVASPGRTNANSLATSVDALRRSGANLIGTVFNDRD